MTIVLVDVDGTLVPGASCERRFVSALWADGKLGARQMAAAAAFALGGLPRHGRHVLKANKAYLAGLTEDEVAHLAAAFVAREIRPILRVSVLDRIEQHRAAGHRVALLTGTIAPIAGPLANEVDAEICHATRCVIADGRYGAAAPLDHPFGAAKLAAARALCATLSGALSDSVAYCDSRHDLPLMEAVQRPVAVAPDKALRHAAVERGWEIIEG